MSAQKASAGTASLRVTLRDSHGAAVANASLSLTKTISNEHTPAATDSNGTAEFSSLPPGVYSLHVTKAGIGEKNLHSLFLAAGENKSLLLALDDPSNSSVGSPQFFDQPQFTVSGVTDTTSLGGHGSDTVVRARDSMAKDTVTLATVDSPSAVPAGIEHSLRTGDYTQARDDLRALIARQEKPELHHLLAEVDERLGDSLEAVHQYQRAAEMDPNESYLFDWGSELLLHHAAEPAEQVFEKGNRLYPRSDRMLIGLGAASFARGSYEQAVQRISQASDLNPDDPAPYLFLGKMLSAEKTSSPEIVDKLHRFVTLQPQKVHANYYYAVALWKQAPGTLHEAVSQIESLLENAIRLDPNFAAAELQLGIVKAGERDYPAAIFHYSRAALIDPQMQECHFRLAQAYRETGQTDKAKQQLKIYQELSKTSSERMERERHEIQQFVYTLRDQPSSQTP